MNPKRTFTKSIIQTVILIALCLFSSGAWANDTGTAPPPPPPPLPPGAPIEQIKPTAPIQRREEEEAQTGEKTLDVTSIADAREKIPDITVTGNGDLFQLLCKASSKEQGWMKSTKAMQVPGGCLVQVTTQQLSPVGTMVVAEALCFVPHVKIAPDINGGRKLIGVHE